MTAKIQKYLLLTFILTVKISFAQFPGAVGSLNTTAIYKDSSIFKGWASGCQVLRGWQDISDESMGLANAGEQLNGTGKAGDNPVVSLGDGGSAILTFSNVIRNGPGFDFAVFENAFNDFFLELAFVEVSSNGVNYVRFPAHSHINYTTQIGPFDEAGEASKIHNLAGKYRAGYGTPFDLEDLNGSPNLNLQAITHVKIIDVVGCIAAPYARYDSNNFPVNDPFPTAFGSGGFDLDAVGVINSAPVGLKETDPDSNILLYPNPCKNFFNIGIKQGQLFVTILNTNGEIVYSEKINESVRINTSSFQEGFYIIKLQSEKNIVTQKIIISGKS